MTTDRPKVPPLDAQVGYWLRFISNRVVHGFSERLADKGVTVAEWVALRGLYDQVNIAPSELASSLKMTRGAVSKLIDRLAAKGLVTKSEGVTDRRYQSVCLTAAGIAMVPQLAALAEANDRAFFDVLGEEGRAELRAMLKDIVQRSGMAKLELRDQERFEQGSV